MKIKQKQSTGPTREQLTDQQWAAVCNLFNVIQACKRRLAESRA